MGLCKYCGEPAGFLRSSHKACSEKRHDAEAKIADFFKRVQGSGMEPQKFASMLKEYAETAQIDQRSMKRLATDGVQTMIDQAFDDHVLSSDERGCIESISKAFEVSNDDIGSVTATKFVKACVVSDLEEGRIPSRIQFEGAASPRLDKNESMVWIFQPATYLTIRTRTEYVGGSHGISVRIAKGVYYRTSRYRGHPVKTENWEKEGVGALCVTNRNLIFVGGGQGLRIPLRKIVSTQLYSDGLQIHRDGRAKPLFFQIDDAGFAADLVSRLDG
jgi:hypothetical protein